MKKLAVPLQALVMFVLCFGMGWMIFVVAGINTTPPTIMDLKARNTQDLSLASMNSTAVALAKQMLANMVPSPSGRILLPVTGGGTATPTVAAVMTLKAVSTFSSAPTPFSLYTYLFPPTATREKPNKPTASATHPLVPTITLRPSTLTAAITPVRTTLPSPTFLPPTLVDTPTNLPTNTPRPPTSTQPAPTDTSRPPSPTQPGTTNTPRPPSPTQPAPTNTSKPPSATSAAPTNTAVPPATAKPTHTVKPTVMPKPTNTPKGPPPTSPPPTNPPTAEPSSTPLASTGPQGTIVAYLTILILTLQKARIY